MHGSASMYILRVVQFHANLGAKAYGASSRQPWHRFITGANWSRDLGRFVQRLMVFDHRGDGLISEDARKEPWYLEEVTDPDTGTLIHRCSEPLRQHQGHGSARK